MSSNSNTPLVLSGTAIVISVGTAAYACYQIRDLRSTTEVHERDISTLATKLRDFELDVAEIKQNIDEKLELVDDNSSSIRRLTRDLKALTKRLDSSCSSKRKAQTSASSGSNESSDDMSSMIDEMRRRMGKS